MVQELSEVIGRLSERESLEVLQMFKVSKIDLLIRIIVLLYYFSN